MPGTQFVRCSHCKSTFSETDRRRPGSKNQWYRCPVCGSPNLEYNSGAALGGSTAMMSCKTCTHTYTITGPQSLAACPSCGGDPLRQGELVVKGETLVWQPLPEAPALPAPLAPPAPQTPLLEFATDRKIGSEE